jgi:hypothetical protein
VSLRSASRLISRVREGKYAKEKSSARCPCLLGLAKHGESGMGEAAEESKVDDVAKTRVDLAG